MDIKTAHFTAAGSEEFSVETLEFVLKAIEDAEEKIGAPGGNFEIFVLLKARGSTYSSPIESAEVITELMKQGAVYSDEHWYRFSRTKHEGFLTHAELFEAGHDGYKHENGKWVADTAKTINYEELVNMLKSKDESLLEAARWQFDDEFRFLDGKPIEHLNNSVSFNSFPRSGNSWLRRLIEQITGIVTGASVGADQSVAFNVKEFKGKGVCQPDIFVNKAHHPLLMNLSVQYDCNKIFGIVRNPLDVMLSMAHMSNTMTHTVRPPYNYDTDFPDWWDFWVKLVTEKHRLYYDTLIQDANVDHKVPLYFIRYEDLVHDQQKTLEGLMQFILEIDDIEGTNVQRRITELVNAGNQKSATYKLKSNTGKLNVNTHRYTEEQLKYVKDTIGDQLYYFGYSNHPEEEDFAAGFTFDEHSEENLKQWNGFRKLNEASLKEVLQEEKPVRTFRQNTGKVYPLFTNDQLMKVPGPALMYATKILGLG